MACKFAYTLFVKGKATQDQLIALVQYRVAHPSVTARSPISCSSAPRLLVKMSVLGCRSPRVSRSTSSASRYLGGIWAFLSLLCGFWCCVSLKSGFNKNLQRLAHQRLGLVDLPLSRSSVPMLLTEASVFGCRLPSVSRVTPPAPRETAAQPRRTCPGHAAP